MSKVKIQGHASGTGVLTVTAPNTSTDRTITLPDATGTLATTADSVGGANGVDFNDNVKARFGTGNDLEIYHDGSNSYIDDTGTGDLRIKGANDLLIQSSTGENMIKCVKDAQVNLYYDNVKKFNTTATGIDVAGTITDDSPFFFIRSTAGQTGVADNVWTKVTLGTEDIDTAGACSNSRFTVPSGGAGIYYISANIYCNGNGNGNLYTGQANIRKNGSETYIKVENNNNSGFPYTQGVFLGGHLNLAEGDYIELYGAMNILNNSTGTFNNHSFMSGGRVG